MKHWNDKDDEQSCCPSLHYSVAPIFFDFGGEGGIRTPVGGKAEAVFKTAAIDHSATSPAPRRAGGPTDVWTVDEQAEATFTALPIVHLSSNPFIQFARLAGREGLEPPTDGFGDRYSTN